MLHNFLSRPLLFQGWTTAILFWLNFHYTQSNLYKWFRMQRHDWSSMSPKGPMIHLSSSPCTGYHLQLTSDIVPAYRTATGSALPPLTLINLHPLHKSEIYVSNTSWYLHREAQHPWKTSSWLVEWSSHHHLECWIPDHIQTTAENSTPSSTFNVKNFAFSFLACTNLNNTRYFVLQALPVFICHFIMNILYSSIVSRFG